KPLLRCEIAATLPAGLYLVTAYGGPPQAWSEEGAEHPLYLRWGYPRLADPRRPPHLLRPLREDPLRPPRHRHHLPLELPEARALRLTAGWAAPGTLLSVLSGAGTGAASEEIKKNSVPPVAVVSVPAKPAAGAGDRGEARPQPRRAPHEETEGGRAAEP